MNKREVYEAIALEVGQAERAFPTSIRVAMQVQQALNDPDCSLSAAVKLVQAEPLLAARVVAMANSVTYNRSRKEVTDVRTAVTRLGFASVRSLAAALVTRQLAGAGGSPAQQALANRLWEHTAHVAALAHLLARRVVPVDPETALFAGIVHEVGGFYMISRASAYPGLLDGGFADWVDFGEAAVGRAVLAMLEVPDPVRNAVDAYFQAALEFPPSSLGDTLMLAEHLAPVHSPFLEAQDDGRAGERDARLELLVGQDTLTHILAESAEEVASLTAALRF